RKVRHKIRNQSIWLHHQTRPKGFFLMQRREVLLAMAGGLATLPLSAAAAMTPLGESGFQKLLASNKRKGALCNFWPTRCEPCRKEMPLLVKLPAKLTPEGFSSVTISADEPYDVGRAGEFLAKAGVTAPA